MSSVHIFVTVDDIKAIAPGADQSLIEDTVRPYLLPAHKIVAAIIGVPLFNDISEERETDTRKYLVTAIVNRVMYDYKLFETVQKRQTGSGIPLNMNYRQCRRRTSGIISMLSIR